jgi:hypothetical protein
MRTSILLFVPFLLLSMVSACTTNGDASSSNEGDLRYRRRSSYSWNRPPMPIPGQADAGPLPGDAGPSVPVVVADAGTRAPDASTGSLLWSENFESSAIPSTWGADGTTNVGLHVYYSGYGTVGVVDDGVSRALQLSPMVSTSPSVTHATLVNTTATYGDMDATVTMTTAQQLRQGSAPNTWEVGWVLWHFTDDVHFYSFMLKENGWELGKEDPAYPGAQRFLATGSQHFDPFVPHTVRIIQRGNTMSVDVDGVRIATATDNERPYASGSLGLYTEDATVRFDDLSVSRPAP